MTSGDMETGRCDGTRCVGTVSSAPGLLWFAGCQEAGDVRPETKIEGRVRKPAKAEKTTLLEKRQKVLKQVIKAAPMRKTPGKA